MGVFIIHEFVTDCTRDKLHESNASDLDAFVFRLSDGAVRTFEQGNS